MSGISATPLQRLLVQQNYSHSSRPVLVRFRNNVINQLQQDHSLVMLVAQNLHSYMARIRVLAAQSPELGPEEIKPDNRERIGRQVHKNRKNGGITRLPTRP